MLFRSLMEEGAKEALAEAEAMGLSSEERSQRENLVRLRRQVRGEDSPEVFQPALCTARQALAEWQERHPNDPQIAVLISHLDTEEQVASLLHSPLH